MINDLRSRAMPTLVDFGVFFYFGELFAKRQYFFVIIN